MHTNKYRYVFVSSHNGHLNQNIKANLNMKRITGVVVLLLVLVVALAAGSQNLVFKGTDGSSVNVTSDRGKVTLLSFSATWAPLASKELAALQRIADSYSSRPVSVYWVSINSAKQGKNFVSDSDLQAFANRSGFSGRVLRDPDQAGYGSLGLNSIPTLVVVDKSGAVIHKHAGFDPDRPEGLSDVSQAIERALK